MKIPVDRSEWNKNSEANQAFYLILDELMLEKGSNKD